MVIFITIWSIWFASELFLNRILRSGANDKKSYDKGSLRIIWITIGVANSLGVLFTFLFKIPISNLPAVPYLGLLIIVIGMIIRFISIWSLGKFFTVDVTIRDNHKIKSDGIYKFIRHPSYSGSILSFIGFGISLNNRLSLTIIIVLIIVAMLNRIRIEEKILTDQFGEAYLDYKKKTYCLVPWVY
jgi:protein-S-isoprenylcysteine O-methyltransferase Ste14